MSHRLHNSARTESPCLDAQQLLNLCIDRMPLGYILWDAEYRVREWNSAAERIFGWTCGEARGKHAGELMFSADPSHIECLRAAAGRGGESLPAVCPGINREGRKFLSEWYNTTLRDASGGMSGILSLVHDISGREQAEQELRDSRKLFQTIIDSEPECVKLLNPDGTLIMMNRAGLDMIQAESLDTVKGRSICPLITSDHRDAFIKLTERVFQGGSGTLAFEMVGIQGRRLWLETHAVPLRNDKDEVIALLGITRDVTERKRAEAVLQKERDFTNAVLDTVASLVLVLDRTGTIVRFNRACEEISGYPAAEAVGKIAWDLLVPPEQAEGVKGDFQKLVAGMFPSRYENEWVARDGTRKLVAWSNTALLAQDGSVEYVIATGIDITERRKADDLLLQEKRFSDAVIDSLPGVFYVCDEQGRLIRWNNHEKEMTGYSVEELTNKNVLELFGQDRDAVAKAMQEVFTTGRAALEARLVTKSGMVLHFFLTGYRMVLNGRQYIVGVGIDISERKRLEEQLRHSQKMESIGTLAGGIAHDFNNILTAIIGYGSILQMKMDAGDPLRHSAEQIMSAANRASTLTQGLLAYSRKQVLNTRPVSVNEIILKVELLLRRLIGEDIDLKTMLSDEDVTVMADSGQLEQVLMNLATNARDAMPGGGSLFIETERLVLDEETAKAHECGKPGRYALITVTDSGVGMDDKTRERIFDPFFTTKELGKGTGLGLAMSYGIIRQHSGMIAVSSEAGKGTTFKICLPLADAEVREEQPVDLPPILGGTETILVAEDDQSVRELTSHMLREFGYQVIEAVDGEDAVRKFMDNKDRVKLLLLDVLMPKKNGREVYTKISIFQPGIKALFLSGYTADIMHQKGLIEPGFNFIMKPVPVNELLRKIRAVIDGSGD